MIEFLQGLPPYLKYVALTLVPWVELRGAIPLAFQQSEQLYLPLILITNAVIFVPTFWGLELLYELLPEGGWIHRKLESIRAKAHPLVEKYGFWGLAVFVAIPLPGTGAYSGSVAAWMLDMDWRKGWASVAVGVLGAFLLVWALSALVANGISLI